MSQTTLLTREPVVNKNRAITANRLIAHGPNIASVVEALAAQADVWPTHHPVFVSLGRLVPTPELMNWTIPDNAAIEIPAQTLAHPQTQASFRLWPYGAYMRDAGGVERCRLYARAERLEAELAPFWDHLGFRLTVPRVNESDRPRDWRPLYDDATAAQVAEICAEDIARFGYGFDDAARAPEN